MSTFPIHSVESAPEGSREALRQVQAGLGLVPNLAAGMAEAPSLVRAFFTVRDIYAQGTLRAADIQVLSLANALENNCGWCVAFHSFAAGKAGVSRGTIEALRQGRLPAEPRDKALSELSRELIKTRGSVSRGSLEAFYAAGLTPAQALEVVLGIGFSVMANYASHLIQPPLDDMLQAHAWRGADWPAG